jgi:hypothetical protein
MGQKRTQNIIDEQIWRYLADFEYELLERVNGKIVHRMDALLEKEEEFKLTLREGHRHAERTSNAIEGFKTHISLYVFAIGLLGGIAGGIIAAALLTWL